MSGIELPAEPPGPWNAVAELVELLPADWVLIGGLMVQLHAWEHGVTDVRATVDVDVLGQARPQRTLQAIDAALVKAGFKTAPPDIDGFAHRYVRDVCIGDRLFDLRRPTLLGAVLIKARSLLLHHDPEAQREDLLRLLSLIEDPRAMAAEITRPERRWLRRAESHLRFDEPSNVPAAAMRRARQALRLLLSERKLGS
jgi:hypothetical protein